jgi:hypothetical protein
MDKAKVKEIQTAIQGFVKERFGAEFDIIRNTASYTRDDANFRITIGNKVRGIDASPITDDGHIALGLAAPGSILNHKGRDVRILSARRTKYLFVYCDDPAERKWVCDFGAFRAKTAPGAAPAFAPVAPAPVKPEPKGHPCIGCPDGAKMTCGPCEKIAAYRADAIITEALRAQFEDLACQLSPENLTCDGELSRARVNQRRREINQKWAALEREVGHKVDVAEIEEEQFKRFQHGAAVGK